MLLSLAALDRIVGRRIGEGSSRSEALLPAVVVAAMLVQWGSYVRAELVHSPNLVLLAAVGIGAAGVALGRLLEDGRRPWVSWALFVPVTAALSVGFGWYFTVESRVGLGVAAGLAAVAGAAMLAWRLARGETARPVRLVRTGLAGALVGLAHLGAWVWIWNDGLLGRWTVPPIEMQHTLLVTMLVVYALGPIAFAVLASPPDQRATAP
jgi:hypothetical protein